MNNPSDKSAISSEQPNEQLGTSELTDQELDGVAAGAGGGAGKVTHGIKTLDEAPKESITFEYGGLNVQYTPQKPD